MKYYIIYMIVSGFSPLSTIKLNNLRVSEVAALLQIECVSVLNVTTYSDNPLSTVTLNTLMPFLQPP